MQSAERLTWLVPSLEVCLSPRGVNAVVAPPLAGGAQVGGGGAAVAGVGAADGVVGDQGHEVQVDLVAPHLARIPVKVAA